MTLDEMLTSLRTAHPVHVRAVTIAKGLQRMNRPTAIQDRLAREKAKLAADPTIALLLGNPAEDRRITNQISKPLVTGLHYGFAVALHALPAGLDHVGQWRELVAGAKRDCTIAPFATALDGVTADGKIALENFKLQRLPMLKAMSGAERLRAYTDATSSRKCGLATSLADAEIIEALMESGIAPSSEQDLGSTKALRVLIGEVQEMRVPTDLPDYESLATDITRLFSRAKLLNIAPIDPERNPAALASYRALEAECLIVGAKSDRDSLIEVRDAIGARQAAAREEGMAS